MVHFSHYKGIILSLSFHIISFYLIIMCRTSMFPVPLFSAVLRMFPLVHLWPAVFSRGSWGLCHCQYAMPSLAFFIINVPICMGWLLFSLSTQHPNPILVAIEFCSIWVLVISNLQLGFRSMTQVLCLRTMTFLDQRKDDLSLQPARHFTSVGSLPIFFSQWTHACWSQMSRVAFCMALKWQIFHSWSLTSTGLSGCHMLTILQRSNDSNPSYPSALFFLLILSLSSDPWRALFGRYYREG